MRRWRPIFRTARMRLMLWNTFVLGLVILALAGALRIAILQSLMVAVDSDLKGRAKHTQELALAWNAFVAKNGAIKPPNIGIRASDPSGKGLSFPGPADTGPPAEWQTRVVEKLFDAKGKRQFGPPDDPPLDPTQISLAAAGRESYSTVRIAGDRVRVFTVPLAPVVLFAHTYPLTVVQLGYSLIDMDHAQANMDRLLLTLIPLGLLVACAGGLFLTGRVLRPVFEITQAVKTINAKDLSQRLNVEGSDEFSALCTTLNAMFARLEESFEQQRRFTADASHELRTPLTVVRLAASRVLAQENLPEDQRRVMERIDRSAGLMSRVVQDLLLLARSDAGQMQLQMCPTHLTEAIDAALICVSAEGNAPIRTAIPVSCEYLKVHGDAGHLTRLFSNLLDNALRHTPQTGTVTLAVRQQAGCVVITVADTGEGIPPEHLDHVTKRFYRVDVARTRGNGGTGLGLSICETITEAHGGDLQIESTLGEGTIVTVILPEVA